jgi:lipopolysaccharide heptosyltransferase I
MAHKRILIVKMSSLGDILHAMPVLRALRLEFPKAFIAWAVQVGEDLLRHDEDLNEVIDVGRGRGLVGGFRWIRDVKKTLHRFKFDIAIDLQGLTKSGLVARLSRAREIIGFKGRNCQELNRIFTTDRYEPPGDIHVAAQNLYLLKHFDIQAELDIPRIHTSSADEAGIDELLAGIPGLSEGFIIIHPGVSRENKRWPASRFGQLCELISKRFPHRILLTGGNQSEYELCLVIQKNVSANPGPEVVPGLSLGQFTALVKRATLFVGNDSGPTHIAFSTGVPAVFLFGPTLPWRNGGYTCAGGRSVNIVASEEHVRRQTKPYVRDEGLMERIEPETVMAAVERLLHGGEEEV